MMTCQSLIKYPEPHISLNWGVITKTGAFSMHLGMLIWGGEEEQFVGAVDGLVKAASPRAVAIVW